MGFGGDLILTAAVREIQKMSPDKKVYLSKPQTIIQKILGNRNTSLSEVFYNNPRITEVFDQECIVVDRGRRDISYAIDEDKDKYYFNAEKHAVDIICDQFGVPVEDRSPELFFTEQEESWWRKYSEKLDDDYIVVEPNGKTEFTPNRLWSSGKWVELVGRLSKIIPVVQVGNGSGVEMNHAVQLNGKLSFRQTALVIRGAKLFLSTIGGLMHLARAVQTHSIILHSGYEPLYMASYEENDNILVKVDCSPCGLKIVCPYDNKCMNLIEVQNVYNRIVNTLDM